jgi:DNA (cytosine-5)-methyltransferase 1
LENVEGLKTHDRIDSKQPIGRTLETILFTLENLGYHVTWEILDASLYGVPQKRKRIYIVGTKKKKVDLKNLPTKPSKLADVLSDTIDEKRYIDTDFTKKLLAHYQLKDLKGKQIKDKRGGSNNIHSWDFELKGKVTSKQRELLEELLKQRRRKSWALERGHDWSDGMPLTLSDIKTFHNDKNLKGMLDDLVSKGYLKKERPKKAPNSYQEEGYNIIAGKLSFEISHILDPEKTTPTLVATDVTRLAVVDKKGLRRLEVEEGLKLFGFSGNYKLRDIVSYNEAFDLLGNSVSVGAIELVSRRLIKALLS